MSDLFDYLAGMDARDTAIAIVGANAPDEWLRAARFATLCVATERQEFTTDHVWAALADLGIGLPPEPRAMGTVIQSLANARQITGTGRFIPTARPGAHCRPAKEWTLNND